MKKTIIISTALIVISITIFGFTQKATSTLSRTEEYAIVDVLEIGKKKYIRVTVGETPTQEVVWEKEKTDQRGDFSPVIKELNKLNDQGFELVNVSLAYTTIAMAGSSAISREGDPRHTFLLKKKM